VYSLRVTTTLAQMGHDGPGRPVPGRVLAATDGLPPGFLDDILRLLRNYGLVKSHRGVDGGWLLACPAEEITVADVIRAVEGPLASVQGIRPHELAAAGEQEPFVSLWIAERAALRSVLEAVSIADLASGQLPASVAALAADPDAWETHQRR
jgi:Rrf2 family protein